MRAVRVIAAILAAPGAALLAAGLEVTTVANLPTCSNGSPWAVLVIDGSSSTDCSTGSGTTEVICACLDGSRSAVTGSGGGVTLDLGDDGGNDSTALSELATDNDDYSFVTEPSADKALFDFAKVPTYQQYDVDRPPSSCAACDEFTGDDDQLTWRWGNQGASTITYYLGGAFLDPPAVNSTQMRTRWTTGPDGSATDFAFGMSYSYFTAELLKPVGIVLLTAGSEATPTGIHACWFSCYGGGPVACRGNFAHGLYNSYTSYSTTYQNPVRISKSLTGPYFLRMRYDSSAKELTCGFSTDGQTWLETAARTLSAHPTTSMGYYADPVTNGTPLDLFVYWWRARTDSAATTDPYFLGQ